MHTRAAVVYKTKNELRAMSSSDLDAYLSWLRHRFNILRGPPRKAVQKRLEVAEKIRDHC
jgi:hypothetical protein